MQNQKAQVLTFCNRLNCYLQADIRMCSHGLRKLIDDKSVPSLFQVEQTCCKFIVIHQFAASCFNKLPRCLNAKMSNFGKDIACNPMMLTGCTSYYSSAA